MSSHENMPNDPLIEAQIERTLSRYRGIATPAMLVTMAENLRLMLTTHPVAVGLLEQLRDHPGPAPLQTEDGEPADTADGGKEGA
jgi:hypothetical protein